MSSELVEKAEDLSRLEKVLSLGADVKAGEGRNIMLLFVMLFLLLTTAYIMKPVREMLILTDGGSEMRSYVVAAQAFLLMLIIPIYGYFSRQFNKSKFMLAVVGFFVVNFVLFAFLVYKGYSVAIFFFIWLGAYGVLMLSQFWAFVSDQYDQKAGERLLALIAFGASLGAWFGAAVSRWLVTHFGPYELMLMGAAILTASAVPVFFLKESSFSKHEDIEQEHTAEEEHKKPVATWDAFKMIFRNRYLLMIALFVVTLNWLNSTGEYLLSTLVISYYDTGMQSDSISVTKEVFIGQFYSDFFLSVNILGALIQFFLVSRIVNFFGLKVAILITPLIVLSGYTLIAFLPIIAIFKITKMLENSLDYSLQNTVRQILYLPTTRREKYEARAVIDTFCWRFGDLLQAGMVFLCLHVFGMVVTQFVYLQIALASILTFIAFRIGRRYQLLTKEQKVESEV